MDTVILAEVVSLIPLESSVRGGKHVTISFCNSLAVPDESLTFLFFRGTQGGEHKVHTDRLNSTSLVATIPAHSVPESVELTLCSVDKESGRSRPIYSTTFTYYCDQEHEKKEDVIAELLQQSFLDMGHSLPLLYSVLPALLSPDEVQRYDMSFTELLQMVELPNDWNMVGLSGKAWRRINTVDDCDPRETLLHFAARHSLSRLVRFLLSLPGSSMAIVLPNEQGHLPIDLAKGSCNDSLVALLSLNMTQAVGADGEFVDSTTPIPMESTSCTDAQLLLVEGEEDGGRSPEDFGTGMKRLPLDNQVIQEMVRINAEWKKQVKCNRRFTLGSLLTKSQGFTPQPTTTKELSQQRKMDGLFSLSTPNDNCPSHCNFDSKRRLRRNSCFIPRCLLWRKSGGGEVDPVNQCRLPSSSVCSGCTGQDLELVEMDRQSRIYWSKTIGSSDARSVDTGLNEFHRITAEKNLQKRLVNIKNVFLEKEHLSNHDTSLCPMQLPLRSMSWPMMTENYDSDDDQNESVSSAMPLSRQSTPRQPTSSCSNNIQFGHLHDGQESRGGRSPQVIVTTGSSSQNVMDLEHTDLNLLCARETHNNSCTDTVSPSLSLNDLDTASILDTEEGEQEGGNSRSHSFLTPDVSQDDNSITVMYSNSAPDLSTLSDSDDLKAREIEEGRSEACMNGQSTIPPSTVSLPISVEESIVEHRSLRQLDSNLSEVVVDREETPKESGKEGTPDSMEDDFVVLRSPLLSPAPSALSAKVALASLPSQLVEESANLTGSYVAPASVEVIRRKALPGGFCKSHRRSLSSSYVDVMREERKSLKLEGRDVVHNCPNGTNSFATILSPISGSNKEDITPLELGLGRDSVDFPRKLELDEHSQAGSMQTLDTSSDDSEEYEETDDQLSALGSRSSLGYPHLHLSNSIASTGGNNILMEYHGVHNLSPVVLRRGMVGARRSFNMKNRYSAEDLITNIDDDMNPESDDERNGETMPSSSMLSRFPHWKTNSSTSSPLPVIDQSDEADYANSMKAKTASSSFQHLHLTRSDEMIKEEGEDEAEKKTSICRMNSLFSKTVEEEEEVVNLSDVDVNVASDELQSLDDSFNMSMEGSSNRFYKQSGSPKTIRRRSGKSSTIDLKRVVIHSTSKQETATSTRKGGLLKEEVRPTITQLKSLIMRQKELEKNLPNDSGVAALDSLTRMRAGSDVGMSIGTAATTATSGGDVQRSGSSISDSVFICQHMAQVVTVSETSGVQQHVLPISGGGSTGTRYPLRTTNTIFPEESSSLDFTPESPLTSKKNQQLVNTSHTLASSYSLARSPPTTMSAHNNSSPASSTSPALFSSHTSNFIMPTTRMEEEEEEERHGRKNQAAVQDSKLEKSVEASKRPTNRLEKSMSVYETCTEPTRFLFDPNKVSFKDLEETGGKAIDKEQESSVKRIKSFFLGSKQSSKKLTKVSSSGRSAYIESIQDGHSSAAVNKPNRARSGKLRKPIESSVMSTTPISQSVPGLCANTQVDFHSQLLERSGDGSYSGGDEANHLTHSSSTPTYPNSTSNLIVSVVEDIPEDNQSNLDPTDPLPSSSPPLVSSPPPSLSSQDSGGESDIEESSSQHITLTTNYPELHLKEEVSWERTIDRKVYRKMNKAEKEHQAILHELLHTEKQHFRTLHVLKLIFRIGISKFVSEDTVEQLFPKLDELIEISTIFIRRMEAKRSGILITDLSSVLLEQLSGSSYDNMLDAFGEFCSVHLYAMDIYKELMKKKIFARLMKDLHSLKECQRLELPDYYTKVTQRLPQLIILLNRLVKKTESLSLSHFPVIHQSLVLMKRLVAGVDQAVEDRKNLIEVMDIESRLEINVPKSAKVANRKDLKNLSLTAHNRKLRKRGDAVWMGHGRHISVQVILVTDFVVLLTERDQKFHLANLQDLKPPVIRLCDLMVRTNASVKSGVQLFLIEQTSPPEMYKLDFADKKKAKEWLNALNTAMEECRQKGLKCECFGAECVVSGDEDKKSEEKEMDSEEDEEKLRETLTQNQTPTKNSMELQRHKRAKESMVVAMKILSSDNSMTHNTSSSTKYQDPSISSTYKSVDFHNPSNTTRPKSTYLFGHDDIDSAGISSVTVSPHAISARATMGEHIISHPIPKGSKLLKEKKKVSRSSTFRNKEKKEDKKEEKEKEKISGLVGVVHQQGGMVDNEKSRASEQLYVKCITALKTSLEEIMNESKEKNQVIEKLAMEVQKLRGELDSHLRKRIDKVITLHHNDLTSSVDMLHQQSSSHSSPSLIRPSSYIDLNNYDDSSSLHHFVEPSSDLSSTSEVNLFPEKQQEGQGHTEDKVERGNRRVASAKWPTKNGHSSPTMT